MNRPATRVTFKGVGRSADGERFLLTTNEGPVLEFRQAESLQLVEYLITLLETPIGQVPTGAAVLDGIQTLRSTVPPEEAAVPEPPVDFAQLRIQIIQRVTAVCQSINVLLDQARTQEAMQEAGMPYNEQSRELMQGVKDNWVAVCQRATRRWPDPLNQRITSDRLDPLSMQAGISAGNCRGRMSAEIFETYNNFLLEVNPLVEQLPTGVE